VHNIVVPYIHPDGNGFWYAILYGTALAAERDGQLIDWDTDVDITVPTEHFEFFQQLIKKEAITMNPPYYVAGNDPMRVFLSKTNDAHVDIWHAQGTRPDQVNESQCIQMGDSYPRFATFPLKSCNLYENAFPCFSETDTFLNLAYGKNWRMPGTSKSTKSFSECVQQRRRRRKKLW